jgi:hypothetical protein
MGAYICIGLAVVLVGVCGYVAYSSHQTHALRGKKVNEMQKTAQEVSSKYRSSGISE